MIDTENQLADRLKVHGHDIYAGGPYAAYADRLAACIIRNGVQCVLVGRSPQGKPESYSQCFQRITGRALPKKITEAIAATGTSEHQTSKLIS